MCGHTSMGTLCTHQVHNHMDPKDNGREEEGVEARPEAPLQVYQHHILIVAWYCTQQCHTHLRDREHLKYSDSLRRYAAQT